MDIISSLSEVRWLFPVIVIVLGSAIAVFGYRLDSRWRPEAKGRLKQEVGTGIFILGIFIGTVGITTLIGPSIMGEEGTRSYESSEAR